MPVHKGTSGDLASSPIGGNQDFQVTFYGVRGSTPCHGDDTRRYGGNTSCVGVSAPGESPLVFDLGTGLRYCAHADSAPFEGACLLTHMHWDHIQGLPFFVPTLRPGSRFDIYAPRQEDGRSVAEVFDSIIRPPMFPVALADLPGTFVFHDTADDEFTVGGYEVRSRLVPHIGNTLGFRVSHSGKSVVYLSDHQMPHDGSMMVTDGARELCEGADLLIHDAQYTPHEFAEKANWGHSTLEYALWVAVECKVKTLALFHHDPGRCDDEMDRLFEQIRCEGEKRGVRVIAAAEGLVHSV
ncbi:MAG: MBL fold metallo-hydrolase [Actinomycetota bacterium]